MFNEDQLKKLPLYRWWLIWIFQTGCILALPSPLNILRQYMNRSELGGILQPACEFLFIFALLLMWWPWAAVTVGKTLDRLHPKAWMLTIPLPIILFLIGKTEEAKNFPFLPEWHFARYFLYFGAFILGIAVWFRIERHLVKQKTTDNNLVV